jgi:hypothetical protein
MSNQKHFRLLRKGFTTKQLPPWLKNQFIPLVEGEEATHCAGSIGDKRVNWGDYVTLVDGEISVVRADLWEGPIDPPAEEAEHQPSLSTGE